MCDVEALACSAGSSAGLANAEAKLVRALTRVRTPSGRRHSSAAQNTVASALLSLVAERALPLRVAALPDGVALPSDALGSLVAAGADALGMPARFFLTLLCEPDDSTRAVPLVVDRVRLAALARRRGAPLGLALPAFVLVDSALAGGPVHVTDPIQLALYARELDFLWQALDTLAARRPGEGQLTCDTISPRALALPAAVGALLGYPCVYVHSSASQVDRNCLAWEPLELTELLLGARRLVSFSRPCALPMTRTGAPADARADADAHTHAKAETDEHDAAWAKGLGEYAADGLSMRVTTFESGSVLL